MNEDTTCDPLLQHVNTGTLIVVPHGLPATRLPRWRLLLLEKHVAQDDLLLADERLGQLVLNHLGGAARALHVDHVLVRIREPRQRGSRKVKIISSTLDTQTNATISLLAPFEVTSQDYE